MQIMIIPGPRDEQKIHQIKLNREMLSGEEWEEYVCRCADNGEEWLDALYYALGENQKAVEEQAEYFHERLIDDERFYYACRLATIECPY